MKALLAFLCLAAFFAAALWYVAGKLDEVQVDGKLIYGREPSSKSP